MKKNLAKRVVLGLLTGAVLMSSSVVWAAGNLNVIPGAGENSIVVSTDGHANQTNSIAIGYKAGVGQFSNVQGNPQPIQNTGVNGVAIGAEAAVIADGGVALGANTIVSTTGSVALGYGSAVNETDSPYVVSVGSGDAVNATTYQYRKIVNVANGSISEGSHEAVTGGQLYNVKTSIEATIGDVDYHGVNSVIPNETNTLTGAIAVVSGVAKNNQKKIGSTDFRFTNYLQEEEDLTEAAKKLDELVEANTDAIAGKADAATTLAGYGITDAYTRTEADNKFLTITDAANTYVTIQKDANDNNKTTTSIGDFVVKDTGSSSTVTINEGADQQVIFDEEGITVGKNSTRMDGKGFYVWADGQNNNTTSNHDPVKAIASINDKGEIKAANGKFKVDADGNVTGGKYNGVDIVELANSVASNDAVAGINQRLDKTNAKINKVGAGAAALAALHPLDYDPDDKLTFSAGMGNYAGENAAALGAFYRPNEKFMVSLGGTMGNGENMVNLGISIGLDKASGFAKMSKRELIQEVNAVKAENEAMKDQLANADERIAKLEALVAQLVAK